MPTEQATSSTITKPASPEEILHKAVFLRERLSQTGTGNGVDSEFVQNWIDDWKSACGGSGRLDKRLQWSNTDHESIRRHLKEFPRLPDSFADLTETVEGLLAVLHQGKGPDLPENLFEPEPDDDSPILFGRAYRPFLRYAWGRLLERLESEQIEALDKFSETARNKILRALLERMARIGSRVLFERFDSERPAGFRMILNFSKSDNAGTDRYYDPFIRDLQEGGWEGVLIEYPVLARLLATVVRFWETNTIEFLRRFQRDAPEIARAFFEDEELPRVVDLETGCSDPHFKGRSVLVIHFEGDTSVVYKPKPVDIEATFSDFITWANDALKYDLYDHSVLPREEYGWVEYISHESCSSEHEVEDYYRRAGELLAILHGFSTTDCHQENLLAHGSQPVIIDYESLFHGQNHWFDPESAPEEGSVMERFYRSVTRTALLPRWIMRGPNRTPVEMGGLSGPLQDNRHVHSGFKDLNTDAMRRGKRIASPPEPKNRVRLDGEVKPVTEYADDLEQGFNEGYRFLIDNRDQILDRWLPDFAGATIRFIFRNTSAYVDLLRDSYAPEYLKNGVDFEINLEKAGIAYLMDDEKPPAWPLYRAELDQLLRGDVPFFGLTTHGTDLTVGVETPVNNFLMESGLEHSRETLEGLNDADRVFQIKLIEGTVESVGLSRGNGTPSTSNREHEPALRDSDKGPDASPVDLMEEVERIRTEIIDQVLEDPDGSPQWLSITFEQEGDRANFGPVDDTLFSGKAGIALFLGAEDFVKDDETNRGLVEQIVKPHRERLNHAIERAGKQSVRFEQGGYTNLGSSIYLYRCLGDFYGSSEYHDFALKLAGQITREQLTRDDIYDLIAGTAGTLLTLLGLYESTGQTFLLKKARICGDHLLKNRQSMGADSRAWDTGGEYPLTGLGHGASGIMIALERLYGVTGDESYRTAVRQALRFEREVYDEQAQNWPDYRGYNPFNDNEEEKPFMVTWCAGAPGIVLSRLALMETLDDPHLNKEIHAGVKTTIREGENWAFDHICCGDMARFETVRRAHDHVEVELDDFDHTKVLKRMIVRARENGGYRLLGQFDIKYQPPGFMTGLAGIGYGLLYWQNEHRLPDVLTLE